MYNNAVVNHNVEMNPGTSEFLNNVLNAVVRSGLFKAQVTKDATILDGYLQITNGYCLIKVPFDIEGLNKAHFDIEDKKVSMSEVVNLDDYSNLRILENVIKPTTKVVSESTILGISSFPNYQNVLKHVGKKTKYLKDCFIGLDNDKTISVDLITKVVKFLNTLGYSLNGAGSCTEYEFCLHFEFGGVSFLIAKSKKELVQNSKSLIVGNDYLYQSETMIQNLGEYKIEIVGSMNYVAPNGENSVIIKNTKYLDKTMYWGNKVVDIKQRLTDLNETLLPYIKVSKPLKDEIQSLIIELNNYPLDYQIEIK